MTRATAAGGAVRYMGEAVQNSDKRLQGRKPIPGIETPGRIESIVDTLFPTRNTTSDIGNSDRYPGIVRPVTAEEVKAAARCFPDSKAQGPDCITNEIIKIVISTNAERFATVINTCFRDHCFPVQWKQGSLVLIPKARKPLDNPSAYRPLCMLDGCGKLLEWFIVTRIRELLDAVGGLTDLQYGFRSGRSNLGALGRLGEVVRSVN